MPNDTDLLNGLEDIFPIQVDLWLVVFDFDRGQPVFNRLQGLLWNCINTADVPIQILPNKHHIEVAQIEANALQVDKVHLYKKEKNSTNP